MGGLYFWERTPVEYEGMVVVSDERKLLEAVKAGDIDEVRRLTGRGMSVDVADDAGWTPIAYAAGRGDVSMVTFLLEHGADIERTGRDRRTPLMIARAARRNEVVERLVAAERAAGVWEDPRTRPFCKAYYLEDLREFEGWPESEPASDRSIVYLHQDLTVTRSMWHAEDVVFDQGGPEWETFCRDTLAFEVPEDVL